MSDQTLWTVLLLLAAGVSGGIALIVWLRARLIACGPPLVLLMSTFMCWSLSYALYWSPFPRPYPLFWLDVTFVSVVIVPTAFLAFARRFVNPGHMLSLRLMALLTVEPALTLLFLFTDSGTGLFFGPAPVGGGSLLLGRDGGPVFWLNAIYSYALVLAAFLLLLKEFLNVSGIHRRQLGIFLLATLVPWAVNLAAVIGLNPYPQIDLTPFAFTVSGVFLAYGFLRYQLLDMVPVARHLLVERMSDAMFVLDNGNRVCDANPAFAQLLGVASVQIIGRPLAEVLARWPEVAARVTGAAEAHDGVLWSGEPPRYLDLRLVPLHDRRYGLNGRLVVLRDVSDRKRAEIALREANAQLQTRLGEITRLQEQLREQALRDPLTGLFNRRYLEETLAQALAQAARLDQPVGIAIIDVDHFKLINDSHGHAAGDKVLQELARLLLADTRGGDIVSRYGGEEFVVVLPDATVAQTQQRTEAWRTAFAQHVTVYEGAALRVTFSAGIAAFPACGLTDQSLLRAADRALYSAKQAGRNRVMVSPLAPTSTPADYERWAITSRDG